MNEDFISISDYAKLRNVSPAAVYKRLDGTLKPYVKIIGNKKYISRKALEIDGYKPVEKGYQSGLKEVETEAAQDKEPAETAAQDKEPAETAAQADTALLKALEALQNQLSEKDKQIERLQNEAVEQRQAAAEKDKFIQEQSNRLSLLLEQSQELQRNNQILLGAAQGVKARSQEKEETQEPATAAEAPEVNADTPGEQKKKKSFFYWLFG